MLTRWQSSCHSCLSASRQPLRTPLCTPSGSSRSGHSSCGTASRPCSLLQTASSRQRTPDQPAGKRLPVPCRPARRQQQVCQHLALSCCHLAPFPKPCRPCLGSSSSPCSPQIHLCHHLLACTRSRRSRSRQPHPPGGPSAACAVVVCDQQDRLVLCSCCWQAAGSLLQMWQSTPALLTHTHDVQAQASREAP